MIGKANAYTEKCNTNKYLTLVHADENKKALKKYEGM